MKIYIIDTETTGLMGLPIDKVLQIGITSLDLSTGDIDLCYEANLKFTAEEKDRYECYYGPIWLFDKGFVSPNVFANGKSCVVVKGEISKIIDGQTITSYNTAFDFDKFLYRDPWNLNLRTNTSFDIADLATTYIKNDIVSLRRCALMTNIKGKIARHLLSNPDRRVHMIDAYRYLCRDDPAGLNGEQRHTALADAYLEAHILKAILCR